MPWFTGLPPSSRPARPARSAHYVTLQYRMAQHALSPTLTGAQHHQLRSSAGRNIRNVIARLHSAVLPGFTGARGQIAVIDLPVYLPSQLLLLPASLLDFCTSSKLVVSFLSAQHGQQRSHHSAYPFP